MSVIKAGLIGYPLGHSMSPYIHERIMEASGIAGKYELYEISPEELPKYAPILLRELTGFNVTIPHKVSILPFLEESTPAVKEYGAANTICGRVGYNTDVDGFLSCDIPLNGRVLLLGAGGVSHMMAIESLKSGADLHIWARSQEKAEALASECRAKGYDKVSSWTFPELSDDENGQIGGCSEVLNGAGAEDGTVMFDTILNGTPCGMWPNVHQAVPGMEKSLRNILKPDGTYFDTVYNPCPTKSCMLVRAQESRAVSGLKMLLNQAISAEKIWAPEAYFDEERLQAILPDLRKKLWEKSPMKLVFTGFMGAGKSTIGRMTAQEMNLPFIDLDDEIVRVAGCPITEIFARDGEEVFRRMERDILKEVLQRAGSAVISLGGGVLVSEENRDILRQANTMVIYLKVDADTIWSRVKGDQSRPLLRADDPDTAYKKMCARLASREEAYEAGSDVVISASENIQNVFDRVKKLLLP